MYFQSAAFRASAFLTIFHNSRASLIFGAVALDWAGGIHNSYYYNSLFHGYYQGCVL